MPRDPGLMIDLVPEGSEITRLALSPNEAAKATGLTTTAIFKLIREGQVRSFKYGRRRLITVRALLEWMDRMEEESGW